MTTHAAATRWNRCKSSCTGVTSRGTACQGCEAGSKDKAQRRMFALAVLAAVTGEPESRFMTCPLTGDIFDTDTDAEVDRPVPAIGYVPGNVILVSRIGNQKRAGLQSRGDDIAHAVEYAADVLRVSLDVPVTKPADAVRWHQARPSIVAAHAPLAGRYA